MTEIWQELLGIEKVGIEDNFFEIGGHSLLAMRLISMIRTRLELEVEIKDIFEFTTVKNLSKCLDIQLSNNNNENDSGDFELLNI